MKTLALLAPVFLALTAHASAQVETVKVRVRVVLVDRDLNQKPVPKLTLALQRSDVTVGEEITVKTGFDGIAEVKVPQGKYRLSTPQPLEFQGKRYSWEVNLAFSDAEYTLELSNDNAKVSESAPERPTRVTDALTTQFKRLQNSVVTVWSEIGHGTGFFVDPVGLLLTNQHVIGPSDYIAIQFDDKRKLPAVLLTADPERDIAVLWADLSLLPEAVIAPIAVAKENEPDIVEGERVFTIGSPMSQKKIVTTGIASKVEPRAIISDININPGNSGGPLFNSIGAVVGLTTFGESAHRGPGLSGIVRIEEANLLLARARAKMRDVVRPKAMLLPVEPTDTYPVDALKTALQEGKFKTHPYIFGEGNYDVALVTPTLKYYFIEGSAVKAAKEKEKRTKKKETAVQGTFRPLEDLKNWAEYAGEYKPILFIQASPKLRETFWSAFGRGLAASGGGYAGPARMRFKTDFYKMKLMCGEKEIQPILPGKIADVLNVHNVFVSVTDATYEGFYSYPSDAISPACGKVVLELYSEKEPDKPIVKILDPVTVERVWSDFEPYRKLHAVPTQSPALIKK